MGIASGIVLYLVVWFMTFFVALPIRIETQGEAGDIVDGTHSGSPQQHHLKKKAWITTWIALAIWAVLAYIIITGTISVRDFDWFNRMG
ncbi:DUF1467 family protein [Roseovarius sp. E0-M6]|uniref:DUF1467 family protein n=1 Tax=Roseovarius sp. E0-M6 TaxID=3127118 RepID=UPI00301044EE